MILKDSFFKFLLILISPRRISMTSSCCPFLCNAKESSYNKTKKLKKDVLLESIKEDLF
jgi:hypothetical protein